VLISLLGHVSLPTLSRLWLSTKSGQVQVVASTLLILYSKETRA
jgi:hypothetical protein